MWTVSNSSSNAARGEPTASQTRNSPRKKLPARQEGIAFTEAERRRSHPRRYRNAARTAAKVSPAGHDHDSSAIGTEGGMGRVIARKRFFLGLPRALHRAREFALLDATFLEMPRVRSSPPDSNSSHTPACCRHPGSPGE